MRHVVYLPMTAKKISDIPSLIAEIGTLRATADLLGMSSQSLWNAKRDGRLPRRSAVPQRAKLEAAGFDAPWSLWGIDEAEAA